MESNTHIRCIGEVVVVRENAGEGEVDETKVGGNPGDKDLNTQYGANDGEN